MIQIALLNKKDTLIITGCEGFIGSNLAKLFLIKYKHLKLIGCGNLNNKEKFFNINNLELVEYWNRDELFINLDKINKNRLLGIVHLGACSSTTEWRGDYLISNNTRYSNSLIDFCY